MLKKNIIKYSFIVFLFFYFSISVFSQVQEKEKRTKEGLSFLILPALSFDSDLGFQYGVVSTFYYFGDGSRYPKYDHSLYFEFSRYTKGGQLFRLCYDSDQLIKKIQTNVDITYLEDMLAYFYGFNGYDAVYDKDKEKLNRAFYRYQNKSLRMKVDFQGHFWDTPWGWIAGLNCLNFNPNMVDVGKINSDKTNVVNNLPEDPNLYLYHKYVDWGMITSEETKPAWVNYVKVGAKYDTRNHKLNPFSGFLTEAMFQIAPSFFFNSFPHTKFAFIHRQYVPLWKEKMNFSYRLFYQTTVGNSKVPFYVEPLLINSFEPGSSTQGLGGARSLRGIMKNRVVGDGFLMVNAEFRIKLFEFSGFKQFFDVYTNPFIDAGYITKTIDISKQLSQLSKEDRDTYFRDEKQKVHASAGVGIKIIMNDNFVLSFDMGRPFDNRDGDKPRMYFTMNYMF